MEPSEESDRPATYGEVFASPEYRAILVASLLSWIGDFLAKVAISYLIFQESRSLLLAATAFAISYVPWIAGGPVLSALAERYPYRRVMIICDLARMVLMASLAIPGVPHVALIALLFTAAMFTPPFESARSALLPLVLTGDRYVVGVTVQGMCANVATVVGYLVGGGLSAINPRLALLLNAGTFALSAMFIWRGVRPRPPAMTAAYRSHLARETAEGFRVVFGHRVLRSIALLVFAIVLYPIVTEGIAVGWAHDIGGGAWIQGVLMAAGPVGFLIGAVVIGRMTAPLTRQKLIRPLALLVPLALVPAIFEPPLTVAILIIALSGFAFSVFAPLNGLFVQVLPNAFRARAFGVMQGSIQVLQGVAVMATGALGATTVTVPEAVGIWGLAGVVLVGGAVLGWPPRQVIQDAVRAAKTANRSGDVVPAASGDGRRERTDQPVQQPELVEDVQPSSRPANAPG